MVGGIWSDTKIVGKRETGTLVIPCLTLSAKISNYADTCNKINPALHHITKSDRTNLTHIHQVCNFRADVGKMVSGTGFIGCAYCGVRYRQLPEIVP